MWQQGSASSNACAAQDNTSLPGRTNCFLVELQAQVSRDRTCSGIVPARLLFDRRLRRG